MADEIVIRGADEFARKLTAFKSATRLSGFNGQRWMRKACLRVIANVKTKQLAHRGLTAPPLPSQLSSRHPGIGLEGHIHESIEVQGTSLIGRVGVGKEIPYARIHELGGPIGSRRKGAFQRFTAAAAGTTGFHQMPRRPYLQPALAAEEKNIQKDFDNEVKKAISQAGLA
jgi:phage gpG-like protein